MGREQLITVTSLAVSIHVKDGYSIHGKDGYSIHVKDGYSSIVASGARAYVILAIKDTSIHHMSLILNPDESSISFYLSDII